MALLLVLGIIVSLFLGGLVYRNDINNRLDSVSVEQQKAIARAQSLWGLKVGDISHTIQLLYRSPSLNVALSSHRDLDVELLERLFASFVESVDTLMQIRWLDSNGIEVVRLDVVDGKPMVSSVEKLQDKSDRYYVIEGMKGKDGEIFLSDIDLNVENGMIEVPYRPTIRATIKTGLSNGLYKGLIVLNYDVGKLLETIEQFDSKSVKLLIVDEEGYWIKHSDPQLEWGKDLNKEAHNASVQNLELWRHMISEDSLSRYYSSLGLVSYQCTSLANGTSLIIVNNSPTLCFIAHTSNNVLAKFKNSALFPAISISSMMLLFGLFILSREWKLRRKLIGLYREQEADKEAIEQAAENTRNLLNQQQLLQNDLVESRKLSALGMMVAGVAHELNTPIGSAIMATSKLRRDNQALAHAVKTGLTKSALEQYLESSETGLSLISQSQCRAAELIRSFKRLAIDRAREEIVTFDLRQVVNDLVTTLAPRFKVAQVVYDLDVDSV